MNNKMKYMRLANYKIQGFTLIEFLVASILAMIVIVAAGGTYLITRKLNNTVQDRISTQQDIRNASVQISRDARMAGGFGCFNTGSRIETAEFGSLKGMGSDLASLLVLDPKKNDGYGVRFISKSLLSSLNIPGLVNPSDALMFIYGQAATGVKIEGLDTSSDVKEMTLMKVSDESSTLLQTLQAKGYVILTSCSKPYTFKPKSFDPATGVIVPSSTLTTNYKQTDGGEFMVSKLYASLYVLGDFNQGNEKKWSGEKSLLRYDLNNSANWSNPQLLARGINDKNGDGMKMTFAYLSKTDEGKDKCPEGKSGGTDDETFDYVNKPDDLAWNGTTERTLPVAVQLRFKYFTNQPNETTQETDAQSAHYILNAVVRGGNTCANRVFKEGSSS